MQSWCRLKKKVAYCRCRKIPHLKHLRMCEWIEFQFITPTARCSSSSSDFSLLAEASTLLNSWPICLSFCWFSLYKARPKCKNKLFEIPQTKLLLVSSASKAWKNIFQSLESKKLFLNECCDVIMSMIIETDLQVFAVLLFADVLTKRLSICFL